MKKVLLSYAAADAAQAERVKERLAALGYHVEGASLSRPRPADPQAAHVVLWSRAALRIAPLRAAPAPLVIAQLDASPPPRVRGMAQANLQHWRGRDDHRGWRRLVAALDKPTSAPAAPTGGEAAIEPAVAAMLDANPNRGQWRGVAFGLLLTLISAAAAAYFSIAG